MIIKLDLDKAVSTIVDVSERSDGDDMLCIEDIVGMAILYGNQSPKETSDLMDELFINPNWSLLEKHGYVKQTDTEVVLRDKGVELFGQSADTFLTFVRKYRDLFPKGIRTGGYLVRADEAGVAEKMRKFVKTHKYTEDEILAATRRYLNERRAEGWKFVKTASYFIYKDGQSALAAFCEQSKEGEYGESESDWTRNVK